MNTKLKTKSWWLFSIILFAFFIVLQVPASWLITKFYKNNQTLHNVSGNFWSGQADWRKDQLRGTLTWKVRPQDFLRLRFGADLKINSGSSELKGIAQYSMTQKLFIKDMNGKIAADTLKTWVAWQWPNNAIQLQNLELSYKKQHGFLDAKGQLQWAAGELNYIYAQHQDRMNIPPLKAQLSQSQQRLIFDVTDQRNQKMMNITIDPQLMLDLQLTQRLLLNSASYQGKAGLDAYVLSTRQPLLRGPM